MGRGTKPINNLIQKNAVIIQMHKRYKPGPTALILSSVFLFFAFRAMADNRVVLPDFGDSSGSIISPVQDKELGEAFFRSVHSRLRVNQDPEIQDFIQSLGHKLTAESDAPGRPFHFFVLLEPVINAFAGPGGYIGINSGLIIITESESELASVIAHEIAHVTQRHLNRAFEAANRLSIPMAAATLAAILIGTQSGDAGLAALAAVQAGSAQYQINFTRDNEKEADRIGIQILSRANFNPRSMPVFFQRLQQSSRYYGKNIPEFLRTHPVTASRVADTLGRAEKYPYRQFPNSFVYELSKAKLRVLTAKTPQSAIDFFTSRLDRGTSEQRLVTQYGLALALLTKKQYKKANEILRNLFETYPESSRIANALGQTITKSGNLKKGLNFYESALKHFPGNYGITLAYVDLLLKSGKPAKAENILLQYTQNQAPTLDIYELLAQTYDALGKSAQSHRYIAEYYYQAGHTRSAITQIKIARKAAKNDFYLTAILDARRKLFEQEEKDRNERKLF